MCLLCLISNMWHIIMVIRSDICVCIYIYIFVYLYAYNVHIYAFKYNQQKGDWSTQRLGIAWYVSRYHGVQSVDQQYDHLAVELYSIITRTNVCGLLSQKRCYDTITVSLDIPPAGPNHGVPFTMSQQEQQKTHIKFKKNRVKHVFSMAFPFRFSLSIRSCRMKGSKRSTVWSLWRYGYAGYATSHG